MLTREDDGEEDEEDELSVEPKRGKTMNLYIKEREGKAQCRLPKPEPNAEYQCRALLPGMGADEADGGKRGWWGQVRLVGAGETGGGRRGRRWPQATGHMPEPGSTEH